MRRRGRVAGVNDAIGRNLHAHLGRYGVVHEWQAAGGIALQDGARQDSGRIQCQERRSRPEARGVAIELFTTTCTANSNVVDVERCDWLRRVSASCPTVDRTRTSDDHGGFGSIS